MTFDLIFGLHMQVQTWHPSLWLCTHAKYYVKSGLTNVLKNANKTKNMHLFSIGIANYKRKMARNAKSQLLYLQMIMLKVDSEYARYILSVHTSRFNYTQPLNNSIYTPC